MGKVLLTCEDMACLGTQLRQDRSTFLVKKRSGCYPRLAIDGQGSSVVPNAGAVLLLRTAETVGLDAALSEAGRPWWRPLARHDPGKVLLDQAVSLAIGGDCLADLAQLRSAPEVFGPVASDPTVSRLVDRLAADAPAALAAIAAARATARAAAWSLAGEHAPHQDASAAAPVVIDVDATLVTAHSEKESAAPTFKRGFGFHPLRAFVDHGPEGTGEPLAFALRAGNAGSNTVVDHIAVLRAALAQLPGGRRPGKNVLIRIDGAGGTHGAAGVADPPPAVLLGRLLLARRFGLDPGQARCDPRRCLDTGLRRRPPGPPRHLRRRGHRAVRPHRLAAPGCG